MKIFIGSDHRGFNLKESLKHWLKENNFQFEDVGAFELYPNDDYPLYAGKIGELIEDGVETGRQVRGIIICGSGVGVDIVANKFNGVRCGLGMNPEQIASARRDDDINVLALAVDEVGEHEAIGIVKAFIETEFENAERRTRRLDEIKKIEDEQ